MQRTTLETPVKAVLLEADLALRGYVKGFPAHATAETRETDASACRALRCPGCGKRGLECHPWHRPAPFKALVTFKVVAACRRCGSCEEA